MRRKPPERRPGLAQRHAELAALKWANSSLRFMSGRELQFRFEVAPSPLARLYRCLLLMRPIGLPEVFVTSPNLNDLAPGRQLPHVYSHDERGTQLCLWLPRAREWVPQMKMAETFLPWTAEWLDYFEEWLITDEWTGGGEHPAPRKKKQRVPGRMPRRMR